MLGFIAADVIRFSDDKATVTQAGVVMGLDNSKGAIVVNAVVSAMKHVIVGKGREWSWSCSSKMKNVLFSLINLHLTVRCICFKQI